MAKSGQIQLTADYILKKVAPLILYTRNAQDRWGMTGIGEVQFTDQYSPNNIRKVVIAPDGVLVYYHVPVNNQSMRQVRFQSQILAQCEEMQGYKPIISLIGKPWVCSSIEELVFITSSQDGGYLTSYEQWSSSDKQIDQFKRLRDIVIYNSTIENYIAKMQAQNHPKFSDNLQNVEVSYVHQDDWYNNWGYRPKYYSVDNQLKPRFEKIKNKYISNAKDAEKNAKQEERVKTITEDFEKVYDRFVSIFGCYRKLKKVQEEVGIRAIGIKITDVININELRFQLNKFKGYEKYSKLKSLFTLEKDSDKDAILENTKILNEQIKTTYDLLLKGLIDTVIDQTENKIIGEQYKKVVGSILTKEYKGAEVWAKAYGFNITDCSLQKSVCNICADICKLTLAEAPDNSCVKYYKSEYWKSVLDS